MGIRENGFFSSKSFTTERMGIRENGYSRKWVFWVPENLNFEKYGKWNFAEHKICDIEIFDIWTSESFPNRFFVFTERVRPMGCHFCTCLNSVLQHCKLMKNTSSAGKGLKTDFQLLVLKLERRGVLFSGLLPPTGGTKTGRKTTFRAHLSYICVKLQICVLQKKSLKKRSNLAKLLVLPSHVRLSSGSLFVLCSGCLVLFIKVQICFS